MREKNYKSKETMLVITVGFLALYLFFHSNFLLWTAFIIGISGVLSFYISAKIDWVWTKLTLLLGEINNRILLTITFFLIVTPVALLRKLFGKKHLLSSTEIKETYFSARNHQYNKEDFEKTW